MSYVEADQFHVNGALRFHIELMEIPANGVLVLDLNAPSSITIIAGGADELLGIEYVDLADDGSAVVIEDDRADVKFIRAAPGFAVTVRNNATEDLDTVAIASASRIVTSSGNDFVLDVVNTQGFFAYVPALGDFRWYLVDRDSYASAVNTDWAPDPTSQAAALDQLAARAPLPASGSTVVVSATPFTIWSYTLAEGEVIGGTVRVIAGADDGGTTLRSVVLVTFTGSRSVGGSAALTIVSETEDGSIPLGTVATSASGNDIIISLEYTFSGTVDWTIRADLDSVTP
jgi:hypothetical protein